MAMKVGNATWRWFKDRLEFFTAEPTLLDMMRLVEGATGDPHSIIEKMFDWEHARRLEVGKWLLALSALVVAGIITLMGKQDPVPPTLLLYAAVGAGIVAASGFVTIWSARSVAAHFARTSALVGRIGEIKTFLARLRMEEGL